MPDPYRTKPKRPIQEGEFVVIVKHGRHKGRVGKVIFDRPSFRKIKFIDYADEHWFHETEIQRLGPLSERE